MTTRPRCTYQARQAAFDGFPIFASHYIDVYNSGNAYSVASG